MALSARELILILRATNQASGPMRQVARDLRTLGTSGVVAGQQLNQATNMRRWQRFGLASAVLRDTGRSARVMGVVAGAGLIFAAKGAADFNSQVMLAATQTGVLDKNLERTTGTIVKNSRVIESSILKQMREFPAAQEDMAAAAYEIFSSTDLGLRNVGEGMKLLRLFNKAAVAGQTDLNEVTQTGITVMQAYGFQVKDMESILNRSFAAVRFGRMTFEQFTQSLNVLVPSARAANQSFDTIAGTMAFLTRRMPNVRMAGTALARMMEIFGRKKFVEGAKEFGVNVTDAQGRIRPLPALLEDFGDAIEKLPLAERANMVRNLFKELSNTEGTIQARRALTHLLKDVDGYKRILGLTIDDQNEFARSLASMEQATGVRWKILTNNLRAFFLLIGAMALPVLMELLQPLQDLFKWFQALDRETQRQTVRWIAIAAAIGIVGGTIAALVGTIGTIIAPFKMFGGSLTLIIAMIAAVSAAVLLLTGQTELLGNLFQSAFNAATSSIQNTVIALGALFLAMQRLTVAGAGMSILGFGRGRRAAGNARAAGQLIAGAGAARAATQTGMAAKIAAGAWAATAASVALLPGPLKVAAGLTAAVAGAAFLFARHQRKAREEAERIAGLSRPVGVARQTGALGVNIRDLQQARINVAQLDLQIKQYRKSLKDATGVEKEQLQLNLRQALLDRGVVRQELSNAQARRVRTALAFGQALKDQIRNTAQLAAKQRELRETDVLGALSTAETKNRVQTLRKEIEAIKQTGQGVGEALSRGIGQALRVLQRADLVKFPQRQFENIRQAIMAFSTQTGRLPGLRDIRAIIKATLDPASLKNMPAQIQNAVGLVKVRARIEGLERQRGNLQQQIRMFGSPREGVRAGTGAAQQRVQLAGVEAALTKARAAKEELDTIFGKAIRQMVNVKVNPPDTFGLGLAVAQGVANGITAGTPNAVSAAETMMSQVHAAAQGVIKAKSPSLLFKQTIGIPIVQGIIVGILSKAGEAADAAVFVIEQIEGKSLAKMTQFLNKQAQAFRKQNQQMQQLVRRGVPLQLLEQLARAGDDGAKQIAKLASSSQRDLRKFVVAWKQANAQVNASARFNWTRLVEFVDAGASKLLEIYNQARDQLRDFVLSSLNDFTELSRRGADAVANAFGQLFQGPQNIAEHIGPAFDDAMDSYASSMADLQGQMQELQERQADTISDFMQRRREELQAAYGRLFSGPILSSGFMAGSVRDLIADLNEQTKAFKAWRDNLDTLSRRGVSSNLLRMLEELGIEGAHNIQLLANATDADLKAWIDAWQAGQNEIETVTQATFMNMEGFAEAMADIAEQMAEVAQRMGELQPPRRADFAMIVQDLADQKAAWTDYNTLLTALRDRGVPGALLTQLAELGIEGVEILRILNSGTDTQLQNYVALWISAQDQIKIAKEGWMKAMDPATILTGLSDQVTALENWDAALTNLAARGVPKEIIKQLREMGPEALPLLQGLVSMTDAQLFGEDGFVALWKKAHIEIDTAAKAFVDTQVALWREQGSKIALGLIAGVMDEQEKLLTFFRGLFKSLLAEAKKETGTRSPSTVYYALGRNIVQGFQMGLDSITPTIGSPTFGTGTLAGGGLATTGGGIQMTVNAHHSESLQSTLERASFRMRQRRIS